MCLVCVPSGAGNGTAGFLDLAFHTFDDSFEVVGMEPFFIDSFEVIFCGFVLFVGLVVGTFAVELVEGLVFGFVVESFFALFVVSFVIVGISFELSFIGSFGILFDGFVLLGLVIGDFAVELVVLLGVITHVVEWWTWALTWLPAVRGFPAARVARFLTRQARVRPRA